MSIGYEMANWPDVDDDGEWLLSPPPPVGQIETRPLQRPRQRQRRRARRAARAAPGSDDGEPSSRLVLVTFGAVDHDAVARLARMLVDRATAEVLARVTPHHSDAPYAINGEGVKETVI